MAKQFFWWAPLGHRGRGQPKNTWRKELEKEMWTTGFKYSWRKMEAAVQVRARWSGMVCGLCSIGSDKATVMSVV